MKSVECEQVSEKLRAGDALDAAEREHAADCETCGPLSDAAPVLEAPSSASFDLDSLLSATRGSIEKERGIRARVRSWSTTRRVGVVLAVMTALLTFIGVFKRRDFDPMFPELRLTLLITGFALVAVLLLRQTLRGPDRTEKSWLWLAGAFLLITVIEPLLPEATSVHAVAEGMFVAEAMKCFAYGVGNGAPIALLVVLLDRRDRFSPRRLWLAGATGASVGLAALALHCRFSEPDHLVAGHTSAALALTAVVGFALFMMGRRKT